MLETAIPLEQAEVRLYEHFLAADKADSFYTSLVEQTSWHQPEISMFGRVVKSPRLAAWYGDLDAIYTYSGLTNYPLAWTPALLEIKYQLENLLQHRFNSVLINLYRDGSDAMGWHSDDEPELGAQPVIASLSLGGTRTFLLRQKNRTKGTPLCKVPSHKVLLNHGALLMMSGDTQQYWQHSISRTKKPVGQRINLTFRLVDP